MPRASCAELWAIPSDDEISAAVFLATLPVLSNVILKRLRVSSASAASSAESCITFMNAERALEASE